MKEKLKVYIVAFLLALLGLSMALYKHFALGFPLLPYEKVAVWTVESKVEFEASGAPVVVSLALPDSQQGIEIVNENFTTSGYGFAELDQPDGSRRAQGHVTTNTETVIQSAFDGSTRYQAIATAIATKSSAATK